VCRWPSTLGALFNQEETWSLSFYLSCLLCRFGVSAHVLASTPHCRSLPSFLSSASSSSRRCFLSVNGRSRPLPPRSNSHGQLLNLALANRSSPSATKPSFHSRGKEGGLFGLVGRAVARSCSGYSFALAFRLRKMACAAKQVTHLTIRSSGQPPGYRCLPLNSNVEVVFLVPVH
jgi:hypothetical protein